MAVAVPISITSPVKVGAGETAIQSPVTGSHVVGTHDVTLAAQGTLSLDAAKNSRASSSARSESESGLFSNGGLSITLGSREQKQTDDGNGTWHSGSTVGSLTGDVTLLSGIAYRQLGSNVVAPVGNISITAPKIEIGAVIDTTQSRQSFEASQSGLTLSLSNPVVSAAQSAGQTIQAAGQTSDPRMKALAAASLALQAKNTWDGLKGADGQFDMDKASGINLSLSLGSSRSQSSSTSSSGTAIGSNVAAGNNLTINATAGDLTVIGSTLTAGNNASLGATGNINLLAAANTASSQSDSSSSSASIGVSVGVGAKGAGWSVTASASNSSGNSTGADTTWTNTKVGAGGTASLVSGQDTTLRGAVVSGKQVIADVGGNLQIESLQDASTYKSRSDSAGVNVSIPLTPGGSFAIGGSLGQSKADSSYQSANTQSGIQAGDAGFQITTAGNTDLKGALIASTDKAITDNRNSLSTGTLTTSDLQNRASYQVDSFTVSANIGDKPSAAGGAFGASGNASGTTRSAISGGAVTITDEAGQRAQTGKSGAQTVASLNRDTKSANGAIAPIFDKNLVQEVEANARIVAAFGREAATAIGSYANGKLADADSKQTTAQVKTLQANAAERAGDTDRAIQLRAEAQALDADAKSTRDLWGETGSARIGLHALAAGLSGGIEGAAGSVASSLALPEIKAQLDQSGLSDTAKQAVLEAASLGIGAAAGGASGAVGAINEAGNNYLTSAQVVARDKALAQCQTLACTMGVKLKYAGIDLAQDGGQLVGIVGGAAWQTYGLGEAVVQMVTHLPETVQALNALVNDAEFRAKVGDAVANDYVQRIANLNNAYNDGGMDGSITSGVEAGRLAVDVVTTAQAVMGIAKIAATAAKAGATAIAGDVAKVANVNAGFKTLGLTAAPDELAAGQAMIAELKAVGVSEIDAGRFAKEWLSTGSTVPVVQTLQAGDQLVKIVPTLGGVSSVTPYWMTQAELASLLKEPVKLAEKLGLPPGSQSVAYDIYAIQAKQSATVFQSTVAPTIDAVSGIRQSGGATQTLVPNRNLFTEAQRVGNIRIEGQP